MALSLMLAATARSAAYDRAGPYVLGSTGLGTSQLLRGYAFDSRGVPKVRYAFGVHYNPTVIAQYGLSAASRYLAAVGSHDPRDLDRLRRMSDWLVANQDGGGRWLYRFDFSTPSAGRLRAPWVSAIAQGTAISLLTRAYRITFDRRYLDAAARALGPFARSPARGGVVAGFAGRPWYEEYPSTTPTHVLNGFMFALIGLYDECRFSERACALFATGARSLRARIARFDRRGGSYFAANRVAASPFYHRLHIRLLTAIADVYPSRPLSAMRARWAAAG